MVEASNTPVSSGAPTSQAVSVKPDMAALIRSVHDLIDERSDDVESIDIDAFDVASFAETTGFAPRRKGGAEVILAADLAVELGHPATASQAMVLVTERAGRVRHGRISRIGPDLHQVERGRRLPFAQVVMLEVSPGSSHTLYDLENTALLINRLPGYMVRSVPGRLWVRVSERGRASGLRLETVGRALVAAYEGDIADVCGVEVLFVTSNAADVERLASAALEAKVLAGRHDKLVLSSDGELDCDELTCETCDEKPVCDDLREVYRQRRKMK